MTNAQAGRHALKIIGCCLAVWIAYQGLVKLEGVFG